MLGIVLKDAAPRNNGNITRVFMALSVCGLSQFLLLVLASALFPSLRAESVRGLLTQGPQFFFRVSSLCCYAEDDARGSFPRMVGRDV